jgi:transcriptional regulator
LSRTDQTVSAHRSSRCCSTADDGPNGYLRGHLARGNPQWREIEASIAAGGDGAGEALAIFDGPDAYVSPSWY